MNESTNHEIAVVSKDSDPGNKGGSHDGAQAASRSVREGYQRRAGFLGTYGVVKTWISGRTDHEYGVLRVQPKRNIQGRVVPCGVRLNDIELVIKSSPS